MANKRPTCTPKNVGMKYSLFLRSRDGLLYLLVINREEASEWVIDIFISTYQELKQVLLWN